MNETNILNKYGIEIIPKSDDVDIRKDEKKAVEKYMSKVLEDCENKVSFSNAVLSSLNIRLLYPIIETHPSIYPIKSKDGEKLGIVINESDLLTGLNYDVAEVKGNEKFNKLVEDLVQSLELEWEYYENLAREEMEEEGFIDR